MGVSSSSHCACLRGFSPLALAVTTAEQIPADASAATYSIVVTAKLNRLNQRAYVEWLFAEMPNDARLREN